MKEADTNNSATIDRQEFMNMMLPQLKLEIMQYERNFDDLRRLFKEFDTDQSNYLSKDELKLSLEKLNITLTDV
jgi:Ca2+-binding EF-hand superfamily protein